MAQLQSSAVTGSLVVTGTITAQEFNTEFISSSILHESGSTSFGNSSDDVHNMTGSLIINRDPGASQGNVMIIENKGDYGSSQDIILKNQYDRDVGIRFQTGGGDYYQWLDSNGDDAMIFSAAGYTRSTDGTLVLHQNHNVEIPNGNLTVDGTVTATSFSGTVSLNFADLGAKTSGTGNYSTTDNLIAGRGSGGPALTINDGYGNANVTFNHTDGTPEQNGNSGRIEVNTDSTSSPTMDFELKANVTSGVAVQTDNILRLSDSGIIAYKELYIPQYIYHDGNTDTRIRFQANDINMQVNQNNVFRINGESTQKEIVVNEIGGDYDFRVEGDANTNLIFANAGNDQVGIGTGTTQYRFNVHSGTTNVTSKFVSSDNQAWISVQDDDSGTYGALFGTDSDAGHDIVLAQSQAYKRLVISSTGNVGIWPSATTSAQAPATNAALHVSGSNDVLLVEGSGSTILDVQGSQGQLFSVTDDLTNTLFAASDISGVPVFLVSGSGESYFDGNLGIGTSNPAKPLHIQTNDSAYGSMRIYRDSTSQGEVSIGFFGKSNSSTNEAWVIGEGGWSNTNDFVIGNENSGAGGNVRLLVQRDGKVGIGTTSPLGQLMVSKDNAGSPTRLIVSNGGTVQSGTSARLSFYEGTSEKNYIERRRDGSGDFAFVSPADDNPFVFENASGEFLTLVNSKVGIGTASPDEKLNVFVGAGGSNGTVGIKVGGTNNYDSLELGIEGNYAGMIRSYGNDLKYYAGHWRTIGNVASENHSHYWYTSKSGSADWSSAKMELDHDGNLGIGTTSPIMGLHVGDTKGAIFGPQSSGGASTYISPSDENTINGGYGLDTDTADVWLNYRGYQDGFTRFRDTRIGDGKGNAIFMVDGSESRVGIGTTVPAQKLDVQGASLLNGQVDVNDNNIIDAKSLRFTNQEGSTFGTVSGTLMFDENFYSDTEYGSTSIWNGNGGGLAIYNEDGWGRMITDANMQFLNAKFNSSTIETNPTDHSSTNWYSITDSHNLVRVKDSNELYMEKETSGAAYAYFTLHPEQVGENFDLSFRLSMGTPSTGYRHLAIAIGSDGTNTTTNYDYLVFRHRVDNTSLNQIRIDVAGTSEGDTVSSDVPNFADGTERHVFITVRNNQYIIEVDGVVEHTITASARTSTSGQIGFSIYEAGDANTHITVRDFEITHYGNDRNMLAPNVGIGTTNPQGALHVYNGTSERFLVDGDVKVAGATDLYITGASRRLVFSNGNGTIRNSTANDLIFQTNGANDRMTIKSTGNVGIGTSSPSSTLHVNGGVHFGVDSNVLNPSTGQVLIETAGGGTPTLQLYPYGASVFEVKSDGTTATIGWGSGADREVNILNTGAGDINVGLGTGAPAAKLHIHGPGDAIRVTNTNTGAGGAQMDLLHYTTSPADNDVHGVINFGGYYSGTSQSYGSAIKSVWEDVSEQVGQQQLFLRNGGNFYEALKIRSFAGAGSGNNAFVSSELRITSLAKTGWGPDDNLGQISFYNTDGSGIGARNAASIRVLNSQGNGSTTTTFEGDLAFFTSDYNTAESEKVRILGDGKVGIGTAAPAQTLHVYGTGTVQRLQSNSTYVDVIMQTSGNTGFLNLGASGLNFYAGGGSAADNKMQILNTGNVNIPGGLNIGTTSEVAGTQVCIVGNGNENLQRWGSTSDGGSQASYRFRIDQNYQFIANSGAGDNFTLDSDDGSVNMGVLTSTGVDINGQLVVQHGNETTAYIARFIGDSDGLQIKNIGTGDYQIGNTQQDNAINFYDGTGGVEIEYNGSKRLEADSAGGVAVTGTLSATADVVAYSSDERLKENIKEIENPIDKIKQIKGVTFDWKDKVDELGFEPSTKKNDIGVIAQDIEKVLPQLIVPAPFDKALDEEGNRISKSGEDYKTVQYNRLSALLIEGIKEQQKQIEALKARIDELENK